MLIAKVKSSLLHKCPRCLEGDMYPDKNPYHLRETANMHSHCPACGLNFEPEPGYYYGAMYVSYAATVGLSIIVFLLHWYLTRDLGTLFFLIVLTLVLTLLAPYTFRTSRAIWLNFFTGYSPDERKKALMKAAAPVPQADR